MQQSTSKTLSALWCAALLTALPAVISAPAQAAPAAPIAKPAAPVAQPAETTPTLALAPDGAVAATVGNEKILMGKVNVKLAAIQNLEPNITQENLDAIRSTIIEDLISERLLIQEAKNKKFTPEAEKVDDAIWNLKSKFPNQAAFTKFLKDSGKTEADLRVVLAEGMAADALSLDLSKSIVVTDADIAKFYNENKAEFVVPEMTHVRHIQVSFPLAVDNEGKVIPKPLTDADKKVLQQKAAALLKKAQDPNADFAALAKANSGDKVSAAKGGDLGYIMSDDIVDKTFRDAAFNTPVGKINPKVIETKFGYNIIKVEDKKASRTMALAEVSADIKLLLLKQKNQEMLDAKVAELRTKTTIVNNFPSKKP